MVRVVSGGVWVGSGPGLLAVNAAVGSSGEGPAAFVAEDVVVATQQDEVVEVGAAAVDPGVEVVDVGPFGGPVTAGEPAVLVAAA